MCRTSTCVCYTCYNMQYVNSQSTKQGKTHNFLFIFLCHADYIAAVSQLPTVEAYDIAQCLVCGRKEWQVESCSRTCTVLTHTYIPSYHIQTCIKTKKKHITSTSANVWCCHNYLKTSRTVIVFACLHSCEDIIVQGNNLCIAALRAKRKIPHRLIGELPFSTEQLLSLKKEANCHNFCCGICTCTCEA